MFFCEQKAIIFYLVFSRLQSKYYGLILNVHVCLKIVKALYIFFRFLSYLKMD